MSSLMSDALQCAIRLRSRKFAPATSTTLFRQNLNVTLRVRRANGSTLAPEQANTRGADLNYGPSSPQQERESVMNEWLKPQIQESEAGMEVTSYLPAELDRA
jgi:hypothetical protein